MVFFFHLTFLLVFSPASLLFPVVAMDQLVVPLTQGECHIAIAEVISLIRAAPLTVSSQHRLNLLLLSYFQDDDAGNSFRSVACLGS
jgi:hypothetical protein